jgi:two-component system chemotaxis response regulator CheB
MSEDRRIRVLIVDDSPFVRKALLRIFDSEPSIMVIGAARNGKEAVEKVLSLKPDVVTLDIMMPVIDGIETLKIIMESNPVPVLILSQFTHEGAELTLKALELGAMDFVDKSTRGMMDFLSLASEIVSKVKAMAHNKPKKLRYEASVVTGYSPCGTVDVVAIGASTGGPPALEMILQKFPRDISFGVLIVQHMPRGFTRPLAERLDSKCDVRVKEAENGDRIEPGCALIAPSGLHMSVRKVQSSRPAPHSGGFASSGESPEDTGENGSPGEAKVKVQSLVKLDVEPLNTVHRPSVDVLFHSVAGTYGSRSIGVILTGMGADGVMGMKEIRERGGTTLAQDEATSVIFGMPKVAIQKGVVDKVVPLTDMAEEILKRA